MNNISNIVIVLVIGFLAIYGLRVYIKNINKGCCSETDTGPKKIRVNKDKTSFTYEYKVGVNDIHCKACVNKIENTINKKEGFYAEVDLDAKTCNIYSNQKLNLLEIKDLIMESGYSVNSLVEVKD